MIPEQIVNETLENSALITDLIDTTAIYLIDIPTEYRKVEKAPLIRINTINDAPQLYASDSNLDETHQVAINVWTKSIRDIEPFIIALDKTMSDDGWFLYARMPVAKDPEIDLYMISRRYTKTFFK
ncbi:MAG TPA: hypothetical protein IAA20_00135 [Candidatus Enterococcus avicola]|uniref:DUF3168 domain-containing protein n=2 Tax=Bacilli TaxID=91061 RepID=A0ABW5Y3D1_9BACL|nr:hypothetical protein [Candidatus Kurthia intestinigallinarum]HIZ52338.1 hypothetical protein [Candidatus Enterococcus avicola]